MSNNSNSTLSSNSLPASGSNVVLVTSDKQRVTVNAYRLSAQSKVFEDMLTIPSDGSNEIEISESKELLDAFLPYCGQNKQPPFDLEQPLAWQLVKAFDKYDIGRGAEAVAAAIELVHSVPNKSKTGTHLVIDFFSKYYFDFVNVEDAVRKIVEFSKPSELEAAFAEFVKKEEVSDEGKLARLLSRRQSILKEKRSDELLVKMASKFSAKPASNAFRAYLYSFGSLLQVWNKSASCTSVAHLTQFLLDNPSSSCTWQEHLPWNELRAVLAALPTNLD